MNRLDFLKKTMTQVAGAVMATVGVSGLLGAATAGENPPRTQKTIGLQLYSLRDSMSTNVRGTLEAVSQMGYKTLETAGYSDGKLYGFTPEEFREMAENLGMKVTGAHIGKSWEPQKEKEIMEWWNTALETQKAVGCTYVIMPSMPLGDKLEDIQVYCDYYNRVGKLAKEKGLKFGFHNHAGEFKKIGETMIMDYLIENTDPEFVTFELDVYWAVKGGVNPVEYIKKHAKRIGVLHIKDESIIGDSGTIDFAAIFGAAYENGIKDFYVEVERYTMPPENCVQRSFDYLDTAEFVK